MTLLINDDSVVLLKIAFYKIYLCSKFSSNIYIQELVILFLFNKVQQAIYDINKY